MESSRQVKKQYGCCGIQAVVLGLIFLKYISDSFKEVYDELKKDPEADPEDVDEYIARRVFWVPKEARWDYLQANAKKPELSILSEGFLAEVKEMPQKNLAFEALKRILNDEIKTISKRNLVRGKSFMELLERTIRKYTNRTIEAAQVIEELIALARMVREEKNRGKELGMSEDELAFYDALEVNDSAVKILGDETLRKIAFELTETIRKSVTIDWTLRESVQAELRLKVKKILRKYGYPPDKEKKATETVLKQAELVAGNLSKP